MEQANAILKDSTVGELNDWLKDQTVRDLKMLEHLLSKELMRRVEPI
ncbi:hypothetical protein LCGC14_0620050 [marine sediment metagenome]|uniref:Uncharacterized protein n=1 Tax=marine sediment metagenome TaxID=412755 RepID=A0A0F9UDL0_9ZZZZ